MNTMHFGIYTNSSNVDILFYALDGNFASTAWRKSDEEYNNILGQKFSAVTADDGKEYNIGRSNLRRTTEEEIKTLMKSAHPAFRVHVECVENHKTKGIREHIQAIEFLELVPAFIDKYGYSEEECIKYYVDNYCKE